MCFVTYMPFEQGFLIGSNRDEHISRPAAIPPAPLLLANKKVLMPIDAKAGGTWISLREDGVALVLLNGAYENHVRKPAYKHSRGLIIPNLMRVQDLGSVFEEMDLEGIEPFTLLQVNGKPFVWRWDGDRLHKENPDPNKAFCLSSATLYNRAQQALRNSWFNEFMETNRPYDAESLLQWLSTGGYGPQDTDIKLKREDGLETVSSTVIDVSPLIKRMHYKDYANIYVQTING